MTLIMSQKIFVIIKILFSFLFPFKSLCSNKAWQNCRNKKSLHIKGWTKWSDWFKQQWLYELVIKKILLLQKTTIMMMIIIRITASLTARDDENSFKWFSFWLLLLFKYSAWAFHWYITVVVRGWKSLKWNLYQ